MSTEYYILAERTNEHNVPQYKVFELGKLSGSQVDMLEAAVNANHVEAKALVQRKVDEMDPELAPRSVATMLLVRAFWLHELLSFIQTCNGCKFTLLTDQKLIEYLNDKLGAHNWSWYTLEYFT